MATASIRASSPAVDFCSSWLDAIVIADQTDQRGQWGGAVRWTRGIMLLRTTGEITKAGNKQRCKGTRATKAHRNVSS